MADDTTPSISKDRHDAPSRGGRPGPNREPGGFRIRLSDNEMRSARALQEAFGLRSTVAVLGFAVRSLGQMLDQGQLDALLAEHRAQGDARPSGDARPTRRNEIRRGEGRPAPAARANPFARPARPAATPIEEEVAPVEAPADDQLISSETDSSESTDSEPATPEATASEVAAAAG